MKLKKTFTAALLSTALLLTGCASNFDLTGLDAFLTSPTGTADKDILDFAIDNVEYLPVKEKFDTKTYDRSAFGPAWTDKHSADLGGNGCDTRNDILNRDLTDTRHSDNKKCVVITGVLDNDPYTGRTINFRRGVSTSSAIQIDHIVSLKDAWLSGADALTPEERVRFANDPDNLIASDGPENMSKGSKAADTWLVPNNPDFRCTYVAHQVLVKANYGLSVSASEKKAMTTTLDNCSPAS